MDMSKTEIDVLNMCYKIYNKTHDTCIMLKMHNAEELAYQSQALDSLAQKSFISPKSDNFFKDDYYLPEDAVFEFELTPRAIAYFDELEP